MVLIAAFMLVSTLIVSKARETASDATAAPAAALVSGGYCLRAYQGHIAVFYDGMKDSPAVETAITVSQLRAVDRAKLESGIFVQTYEEVLKLLEDFGS
jgi:hypothetical protein